MKPSLIYGLCFDLPESIKKMTPHTLNLPKRSRQAIPDLIDLTDSYTQTLDVDCLPVSGLNLKALKRGVKAYAKSAFDIRGVIQLGSRKVQGPESVTLPIGLKGRKLHFLQGAYGEVAYDVLIAQYILHYADGSTRSIPLSYGSSLRNLSDCDLSPLTHAKRVLLAPNAEGNAVQVARFVVNNPQPDVILESIEFVSAHEEVAPFVVAITLERNDPVYEWFDSIKVGLYNPILERSKDAQPNMIDLSAFYGASLDDDWFNHSSHDLHDMPKGVQSLAGTKFDLRGLIVLAGSGSLEITGLALPEAVCGIPVNQKGSRLHFLQACGFSAPCGTQIGEYVIHYANGQKASAAIIYGENIIDWWLCDIVTNGKIAWIGSHAAGRRLGMQTRLVKYSWDNPFPEEQVTSIDFVSALENPAPFLVAITLDSAEL